MKAPSGTVGQGIKLMSSMPSVLSRCKFAHNHHMGLVLREHAAVHVLACRIANNSLGVACLQQSWLLLVGSELVENGGFGLVCHEVCHASWHTILRVLLLLPLPVCCCCVPAATSCCHSFASAAAAPDAAAAAAAA